MFGHHDFFIWCEAPVSVRLSSGQHIRLQQQTNEKKRKTKPRTEWNTIYTSIVTRLDMTTPLPLQTTGLSRTNPTLGFSLFHHILSRILLCSLRRFHAFSPLQFGDEPLFPILHSIVFPSTLWPQQIQTSSPSIELVSGSVGLLLHQPTHTHTHILDHMATDYSLSVYITHVHFVCLGLKELK